MENVLQENTVVNNFTFNSMLVAIVLFVKFTSNFGVKISVLFLIHFIFLLFIVIFMDLLWLFLSYFFCKALLNYHFIYLFLINFYVHNVNFLLLFVVTFISYDYFKYFLLKAHCISFILFILLHFLCNFMIIF